MEPFYLHPLNYLKPREEKKEKKKRKKIKKNDEKENRRIKRKEKIINENKQTKTENQ